jgi:thiol-disulfide isomerase/thioredoxin
LTPAHGDTRRRVWLAWSAAALALALGGCRAEHEGGPAPAPAPRFVLPDLDGRTVSLDDLAGRTVVIDFWATWCAPCEKQIPILNAFHRVHAGEEVVVLGIAVDAGGREVVEPFADQHAIEYPVLLGSERLARDYGAPGFPALAVVDAAGALASLHLGVIDPEELEAALAAARQ